MGRAGEGGGGVQMTPSPWVNLLQSIAWSSEGLTLFGLGFFGVPGPGGGGGGFKSPLLHKSESIDAIDMKLGGYVEHN